MSKTDKKAVYLDSEDYTFWYEDKKKTFVSSVVHDESNIKFDWKYEQYIYTVILNKTNEEGYWAWYATSKGEEEKITVGAFVRYKQNGIDITGDTWFEDGQNSMWVVSLAEA